MTNGDEDEKTQTELMAERADAWKMARSMLQGTNYQVKNDDILKLADWLINGVLED